MDVVSRDGWDMEDTRVTAGLRLIGGILLLLVAPYSYSYPAALTEPLKGSCIGDGPE